MSEYGRGDHWPEPADGPGAERPVGPPRIAPPPAAPPRAAAPPARRGASGLVITLAAIFVLVLCGGGTLALYLMHSKGSIANAQSSSPAAAASGPAGARASAAPSYDASTIVKGQCVANDGTGDVPKLRVVSCAPGSYLVLARLDGTADTNRCTMVPGSTHDFFYQTTPSTSDFVLCLKKQ